MDTRDDILAAARSVFARRGFDGTSVREVAAAAKVNNAMIYYHFKDKDHLYRSVLSDSLSAMKDIWSDPVFTSDRTVREKLRVYVEAYIRFHMVNDDLRRILAMEFAGSGGKSAWICEYFADNYSRLISIFQEGIRRGELKNYNASIIVSSLLGIIVHNFIMQPMAEQVHGKRISLAPKTFGSFVVDLILTGLATSPGSRGSRTS